MRHIVADVISLKAEVMPKVMPDTTANTSVEEATIITSKVLPENAAVVITTMSLTNPETHVEQDNEETLFGSHIKEAIEILRAKDPVTRWK